MNGGFGRVENRLVGIVKGGHVGIGDGNVGSNLVVEQLVDGEVAAELGVEVVHGHVALGQLLVELVLGIGRPAFVDLGFDVGIGGGDTELFGLLPHDLGGDQPAEQVQ